MNRSEFYYKQLVTEIQLNQAFDDVEALELNLNQELKNTGVNSGLNVTSTSPISTEVEITQGVGRIPSSGRRVYVDTNQNQACDQDEFGNPTYTDLGVGEGRWCSIFIRSVIAESDPKVDGYGNPLYYRHSESYEFFVHRAPKGLAVDKDTLARPGTISTAILLADIWFEDGSTSIDISDIDTSRREDYFRALIAGSYVTAGNHRDAIGHLSNYVVGDLSDPDLPTGNNDGAHYIGFGGHATEAEFEWANGNYLSATGDNVHEAIEKIVADLGNSQAQGVSGGRLVSSDTTAPIWHKMGIGVHLGDTSGRYDGSVMGAIDALVIELGLEDTGSKAIGNDAIIDAPYNLGVPASVFDHITQLLGHLNAHVNVDGHPAAAISYSGSAPNTWADGSALPADSVEDTIDRIVNDLGNNFAGAGSHLIGGEGFSQSYDGETLSIPSGEVYTQLNRLLSEILERINVHGDDSIDGHLSPNADNSFRLGSAPNNWMQIHTRNIFSNSGLDIIASNNLLLRSASGYVNLDCPIGATISTMYNGVRNFVFQGDELYPYDDDTQKMGSIIRRFQNIYSMEHEVYTGVNLVSGSGAKVYDPEERSFYRTFQASANFTSSFSTVNPTGMEVIPSPDGRSISNRTHPAFSHHPINLAPGQIIKDIGISWDAPINTNSLQATLYGYNLMLNLLVPIKTINPSVVGGSYDHFNLASPITAQNSVSYWITVDYIDTDLQNVYTYSVEIANPEWPL